MKPYPQHNFKHIQTKNSEQKVEEEIKDEFSIINVLVIADKNEKFLFIFRKLNSMEIHYCKAKSVNEAVNIMNASKEGKIQEAYFNY